MLSGYSFTLQPGGRRFARPRRPQGVVRPLHMYAREESGPRESWTSGMAVSAGQDGADDGSIVGLLEGDGVSLPTVCPVERAATAMVPCRLHLLKALRTHANAHALETHTPV